MKAPRNKNRADLSDFKREPFGPNTAGWPFGRLVKCAILSHLRLDLVRECTREI